MDTIAHSSARFLFGADPFLGTLPSSGVGFCPLTANRQTPPVAETFITSDIHLSLDVLGYLATKIALNRISFFDSVTETGHLIIGEIFDATVGIDFSFFKDLV